MLCADGRTIRKDAFKDDDGRTVPLVYQHNHDDPTRVIGHALLENRDEGVYAYCSLNSTNIGQHVRECVRHGDINGLSIFANKLTQRGGDVLHGVIRELSVVLAGANPGAVIEFPILEHGEESETEAYIWSGEELIDLGDGAGLSHAEEKKEEEKEEPAEKKDEPAKEEKERTHEEIQASMTEEQKKAVEALVSKAKADPEKEKKDCELSHAEEEKAGEKSEDDETVQDVLDSMSDKQRQVVEFLVGKALGGDDEEDEAEHFDDSGDALEHAEGEKEETVQDVLDSMTEKQRKVTEYLVGKAMEAADEEKDADEKEDEEASHSDIEGEETTMKKNVFDNTEAMDQETTNTLSHDAMMAILDEGKKCGSLRHAVDEVARAEYGIDQIDWLFPDARNIANTPGFIQKDVTWVNKVLQGTTHTPFSRIKTLFADITDDEARARGYIKGKQKKNEVFTLLKRTTDPQTIYKKQKLDRDDIVDITDFDVVAWMKQEMRGKLDEEIARAILVGDGRETDSDDHINENHVRSIFRDEALYAIHINLEEVQGEAKAKTFIKAVRRAWKDYQGSGNCVAYMTEDMLADLMLLEDGMGHFMYPTRDVVANVLGVQGIVTVPPMAEASTVRTDATSGDSFKPLAIIVNLKDYNVGADKGGAVNMFEDFDIDYNAQKYLIETRCSGALVRPYSALVIEEEVNPI